MAFFTSWLQNLPNSLTFHLLLVMFIENKVDLPDKVITSEMGAKFVARVDGASYNLVPKNVQSYHSGDLNL